MPAIIGLAEALKIADKDREKESTRLVKLRDYFIKDCSAKFENCLKQPSDSGCSTT